MTLTWLDLYLVILVGKPNRLKVSTYLVFKLTGMPNVLPVLWDAKATLGIKIVPPPRLGSAGLDPPLIRQQLYGIRGYTNQVRLRGLHYQLGDLMTLTQLWCAG